jgi:hypothetical protein
MALGTPVAAFAIPPVAELTEGDRYGWMAEPGSAEALGRAMLAAATDAGRDERAAAARAHAAEHYSLAAVARRLGDLLEQRARRAATDAGAAARRGAPGGPPPAVADARAETGPSLPSPVPGAPAPAGGPVVEP